MLAFKLIAMTQQEHWYRLSDSALSLNHSRFLLFYWMTYFPFPFPLQYSISLDIHIQIIYTLSVPPFHPKHAMQFIFQIQSTSSSKKLQILFSHIMAWHGMTQWNLIAITQNTDNIFSVHVLSTKTLYSVHYQCCGWTGIQSLCIMITVNIFSRCSLIEQSQCYHISIIQSL